MPAVKLLNQNIDNMDRREYLQTTAATITPAFLPTTVTEANKTPPRIPNNPSSRNVAWYLWWAREFDFHRYEVRRPIVLSYLDDWGTKHRGHAALDLASRGVYQRDELPRPPHPYDSMKPPHPFDHVWFD